MKLQRVSSCVIGLLFAPLMSPALAQAQANPDSEHSYVKKSIVIGKSVEGRPIRAWFRGDPKAKNPVLVLDQMHGDEPAGPRTARWMRKNLRPRPGTGVWTIETMNPD